MMEDAVTSSSSDEETKQRILSAVWNVNQPHSSFTTKPAKEKEGETTEEHAGISAHSKSLRAFKGKPEFCEDFGGIKASPELKSFVAKKLVSYLDGVITEYKSDRNKPQDTEYVDDFRLFSTSKLHDASNLLPSVALKQPNKLKVIPDSSSDSDSVEERQKLASAAVSFEDVIHSQSILSSVAEDKPALLLTSDVSPRTLEDSTEFSENKCQKNNFKDIDNINNLEVISNYGKKKKKKKEKLHHEHLEQSTPSLRETKACPDLCEKVPSAVDSSKYVPKTSYKSKPPDALKSNITHGTGHQGKTDDTSKMHTDTLSRKRKKQHKSTLHPPVEIYEYDTGICESNSLITEETLVCEDYSHVKKSKKKKKNKKVFHCTE